MATNFPTSLDALTNPTSGDTLASPDHAGQHSDANDAIEALQAKVGVNGSAVATSLDYLVAQKANINSPTFTGTVTVPTPATATSATTKSYVDGVAYSYLVSATTPVSPTQNQVWFNSDDGKTYIYYNDGNTSQWVEFGNANVGPAGATGATGATGDSRGLTLYLNQFYI